jgi:DHA2 family multidrug resistance protein-like MFS transporter
MAEQMPAGLDAQQVDIATDTLGGALGVVAQLPPDLAEPLLAVVQSAFAEALHANVLIGGAIMAATAILTAVCLREVRVSPGGH